MNSQRDDASLLLFEVLERAIRLYSHVERSCRIASRPGARTTAQLKIAKEAQHLLLAQIEEILSGISESSSAEKNLAHLLASLNRLALIHTRVLVAVPRPHEPIELVSYLRQTLLSSPDAEGAAEFGGLPEVFASEALGDQAHDRYLFLNPEAEKIEREAAQAILGNLADFAEKHLVEETSTPQPYTNIGYVSLPRIDLGNPCRWSSLLHEVGHFHISPESLWVRFCTQIGLQRKLKALEWISPCSSSQDEQTLTVELQAWLQECWCDAFAITRAGPSAFFAQMHAFLFGIPCYLTEPSKKGAKYPPAWFRLKLLLAFAESRFDAEDPEAKTKIFLAMENEKKRIYRLFSIGHQNSGNLFQLLHLFRDFLSQEFPRNKYRETSSISSDTLDTLVKDLGKGLPIPSVEEQGGNSQRAATPAEIMLAGWMHRCEAYKFDFLGVVDEWKASDDRSIKFLVDALKTKVDRADESLKRSLQMVEWFRILDESAKLNEKAKLPQKATEVVGALPKPSDAPGLLSDIQISELLVSGELRVIPLIDSERQVSGSVIDLRLGHNFEIFFSNVQGSINPLHRGNGDETDSMEMDVDFLKSISIGPGQFLLGHTREYIKLPDAVAAQIEGRSSFARLGLQVHMTANLVEAGFDGCLTLEIANCGHSTIILYPGMRIAQLRFFRLVTPPKTPYGAMRGNKYRGLLSHNKTQQFSDWEVDAFEKAGKRLDINFKR